LKLFQELEVGIKKSGRKGESKYATFEKIVRTFENATIYPYAVQ
jgi:hypothetical protein